MNEDIRLQVFLSQRGIASRRRAAEIVREGRVQVNETIVTEPGQRVNPLSDRVRVDHRNVPPERPAPRTILLYKPVGILCSTDTSQGKTVLDIASPRNRTLRPAGRLDKDSEGLVVLSNDGNLIQHITHPRFRHVKRYRVEVEGWVNETVLRELRSPIDLDGYRTRPADIEWIGGRGHHHTLLFRLGEGRNRQIRKLCARSRLTVRKLVRISIGPLEIGNLRPGQWREVTKQEVSRFLKG